MLPGTYIYIYIYIHIYTYIYIYIYIYIQPRPRRRASDGIWVGPGRDSPDLRRKNLGTRGWDPSRFLFSRGKAPPGKGKHTNFSTPNSRPVDSSLLSSPWFGALKGYLSSQESFFFGGEFFHTHTHTHTRTHAHTHTHTHTPVSQSTVSFHNFKSQNFKLCVSNPKSKYVAFVSVQSQISNCQGLGRKNKRDILKTDRITIAITITITITYYYYYYYYYY